MARSILLAAAVAWLIAGAAAVAIAAFGTGWLQRILPPLAIDADAIRGAAITIAVGVIGVGLSHLAVLAGMRGGHRLAWSGGILLAGFLAAALFALAAAAATSAVAVPASAAAFVAVAIGTAVASAGYGLVAVLLIGERRSESTV